MIRPFIRAVGVAVIILVVTPLPAYGYIDPVSGSIILQVIAGAILGVGLTFRRIVDWLRGARGGASDRGEE